MTRDTFNDTFPSLWSPFLPERAALPFTNWKHVGWRVNVRNVFTLHIVIEFHTDTFKNPPHHTVKAFSDIWEVFRILGISITSFLLQQLNANTVCCTRLVGQMVKRFLNGERYRPCPKFLSMTPLGSLYSSAELGYRLQLNQTWATSCSQHPYPRWHQLQITSGCF